MSNSDSTKNREQGPGAPVWKASSAFLETPAELFIKKTMTSGTNQFALCRWIYRNDQRVHNDDHKTFVMMTSVL